MNFFDIIFTVLFVLLIGLGLRKGILRETLSTLGFIAGYLAAEGYYQQFFYHILKYVNDQTYAKIITYIAIFFLGAAIGMVLSGLAHFLFSSGKPSTISRLFGGGFGMVKGILVSLIIVFVVQNWLVSSFGDDLNRSFFSPWLFEIKTFINQLEIVWLPNVNK